jgi:hypothetical protein
MTKPNDKKTPPTHRFHLPNDLQVTYSNIVRIAHTPSEIMFDFARMLPGDPAAGVNARVLMSPLGAKLLHRALTENLSKYEAAFGEIPVPHTQSLADFLFRPPESDEGDQGEGQAGDADGEK